MNVLVSETIIVLIFYSILLRMINSSTFANELLCIVVILQVIFFIKSIANTPLHLLSSHSSLLNNPHIWIAYNLLHPTFKTCPPLLLLFAYSPPQFVLKYHYPRLLTLTFDPRIHPNTKLECHLSF